MSHCVVKQGSLSIRYSNCSETWQEDLKQGKEIVETKSRRLKGLRGGVNEMSDQ